MRPSLVAGIARNIAAWTIVLVITFPLLWMILTSVKPQAELFHIPPSILPGTVTFEHYVGLLTRTPMSLRITSVHESLTRSSSARPPAVKIWKFTLRSLCQPGRRLAAHSGSVGRLPRTSIDEGVRWKT